MTVRIRCNRQDRSSRVCRPDALGDLRALLPLDDADVEIESRNWFGRSPLQTLRLAEFRLDTHTNAELAIDVSFSSHTGHANRRIAVEIPT